MSGSATMSVAAGRAPRLSAGLLIRTMTPDDGGQGADHVDVALDGFRHVASLRRLRTSPVLSISRIEYYLRRSWAGWLKVTIRSVGGCRGLRRQGRGRGWRRCSGSFA